MGGGLVVCAFCGKARGKKIKIETPAGVLTVCERHFLHHDGTRANKPTEDAIIRLWLTSD